MVVARGGEGKAGKHHFMAGALPTVFRIPPIDFVVDFCHFDFAVLISHLSLSTFRNIFLRFLTQFWSCLLSPWYDDTHHCRCDVCCHAVASTKILFGNSSIKNCLCPGSQCHLWSWESMPCPQIRVSRLCGCCLSTCMCLMTLSGCALDLVFGSVGDKFFFCHEAETFCCALT